MRAGVESAAAHVWLPKPVKDPAATRVGDAVHLHWTMPKETTDKVALKGDQRAHFCWEDAAMGEKPAGGAGKAGAGKAQKATPKTGPDSVPGFGGWVVSSGKGCGFYGEDAGGAGCGCAAGCGVFCRATKPRGEDGGTVECGMGRDGAAPQGVTGLRLETRAEGVVLHWDEAAARAAMVLRIHRMLVPGPAAEKANAANGAPPAEQQVLEVDLGKGDPGVALDHDAVLDHAWKYWAERVMKVEIDQHAMEIAGPPSATVAIDAKDVFAPAVPAGVAAVADAEAKAIDLSWTPDTDSDLAGYVVYRRDVTAGTAMERISGTALVVPPSFGDTTVVAGHRYAYAVSAVDRDGNESARSGEVVEEIPQ